MITSPEAWNGLLEAGGFTEVFFRKAREDADTVYAAVRHADRLLAESARPCVEELLQQRLAGVYAGLFPRVLADHMGMGEYAEKVLFSDSVTPGLQCAAEALAEWIRHGGWEQVIRKYPLARKLETTVRSNFIASQIEFLERYEQCRPEISERFFGGKDAGKICSYLHLDTVLKQHGRTVIGLQCEGGRCYYKPRDCSADAFYRELVESAFSDITCAPAVIEGDGFGFIAELEKKPLERAEDTGRYFYNYGALSALYLGLNGGDLHAKNVLACGIRPSSVDLEDLFTPGHRLPGVRFRTAGEKAELRSLASMAVLPARDFVSPGPASPFHASAGYSYENLPVFNGTVYGIDGHEEDFILGFRDGYGRMLALREQVISALEKRGCMTLRSLYNSPTVQNMIMERIHAPEFYASEEKTERELDRLRISYLSTGKEFVPSVLEYEKKCIRDGDLPYYCADLFSPDLFGNDTGELLLENGFEESPFDSVKKKLYSLGEAEEQMEEKLIRLAFGHALLDAEREERPVRPVGCITGDLIRREISEILDRTAEEEVRAPGGEVFLKSSALFYIGRKALPFYALQADVLNLCGRVISAGGENAEKAEALAAGCLDGITSRVSLWKTGGDFPFEPGIFCGAGALLNGLASAERAGVGRSRELLDDLVRTLSGHPMKECTDITPAYGLAGLLAALCGIPERKDAAAEAQRLTLTARLADRIAESLRGGTMDRLKNGNDPFRGLSGIGAALAMADKAAGTHGRADMIGEIFSAVGGQFNEGIRGWYSAEKGSLFRRGPYAAGIGLCALQASGCFGEVPEGVRKCLELSIESEMNEETLYDRDVIRNGNALRALFLDRCERSFPGRGYGERARGILAAMIGRKQETGDYIVFPPGLRNSFDPSFMLGTAGIGAVLTAFG